MCRSCRRAWQRTADQLAWHAQRAGAKQCARACTCFAELHLPRLHLLLSRETAGTRCCCNLPAE